MKKRVKKFILIGFFLFLGLLYVIRFGGIAILRLYIETGVGNCQKIPVLCAVPLPVVVQSKTDPRYIASLVEYQLPQVQISVPKEFRVIKQSVERGYYKKFKNKTAGSVIYLLYEPNDFFIRLFTVSKKAGINNDYDFIKRVMEAKLKEINGLSDAFFVIMKGIFTPDLADQSNLKMLKFSMPGYKGFISYNTQDKQNYFNCDVITNDGYFKIYIKDKLGVLDLDKVFSIISTIKKID